MYTFSKDDVSLAIIICSQKSGSNVIVAQAKDMCMRLLSRPNVGSNNKRIIVTLANLHLSK